MNAPPPVASTCGASASRRAITRRSPSRKAGSPYWANISAIGRPAAASTSASASRNGMPSAEARRRPTLLLPTPDRPTRAMVLLKGPGLENMSVSGFTRAAPAPPTSPRSDAWIEAFLEMMAAERAAAANTLKAYARDLADAESLLAPHGADLASATDEQIEAYFTELGARGLSPATAARRRAARRQLYRFVLGG